MISNISKERKTYFKGAFGPYYREYGFKYSSPAESLHNFIGILQTGKRLGVYTEKVMYPERIEVTDGKIALIYKKPVKGIVNVAWFDSTPPVISDGKTKLTVRESSIFKGPYGWVHLFQSKDITTNKIELTIGE